jgi:hypothetical protein
MSELFVITTYFNPAGYASRRRDAARSVAMSKTMPPCSASRRPARA